MVQAYIHSHNASWLQRGLSYPHQQPLRWWMWLQRQAHLLPHSCAGGGCCSSPSLSGAAEPEAGQTPPDTNSFLLVDFVRLWEAERTLEQITDKIRSLRSHTDDDEQSDSLRSAGGASPHLLVIR